MRPDGRNRDGRAPRDNRKTWRGPRDNNRDKRDNNNGRANGEKQQQSSNNQRDQGIRPPNKERSYLRRPDNNQWQRQGQNPQSQQGIKGGVSGLFSKYDELINEHLRARKHYFEMFGRCDYNQKRKLERRYFETIDVIRRWENTLASWQKEFLEQKTNPYKLDTTYSQNHPEEKREPLPSEQINPHILPSQIEAKSRFKGDAEESKGTEEDYKLLN